MTRAILPYELSWMRSGMLFGAVNERDSRDDIEPVVVPLQLPGRPPRFGSRNQNPLKLIP